MQDLCFQCNKQQIHNFSKVYHKEECTYLGNEIEVFQLIASEFICQEFCFLLDDCEFFLYDMDVRDCRVFDSLDRQCQISVGPGKGL